MLVQRMIRAARLEGALYEEVEHDRGATGQAAAVVFIGALLSGIGALMIPPRSAVAVVATVLSVLIAWLAWAALTLVIGRALFKGTSDFGEMVRVLGFAATPLCLGIVPVLGSFVGAIWALVCSVVAVKHGLDISTGRALVTLLLGFVAYALIRFAVHVLAGFVT